MRSYFANSLIFCTQNFPLMDHWLNMCFNTYLRILHYCNLSFLRLVRRNQSHHLKLLQLLILCEFVFRRHHKLHYMQNTLTNLPMHNLLEALERIFLFWSRIMSIINENIISWNDDWYPPLAVLTSVVHAIHLHVRELLEPATNSFLTTSWPRCSYPL